MPSCQRPYWLACMILLYSFFLVAASAFSIQQHNNNDNNNDNNHGATTTIQIRIIPSTSQSDLMALADLRYEEWMMEEAPETRPSLQAFRMATAEIQQERMADQAIPFLARCEPSADGDEKVGGGGFGGGGGGSGSKKKSARKVGGKKTKDAKVTEVVGAAELSPIEFNGCFDGSATLLSKNNEKKDTNVYNQIQYWYITDVVTAKTHRRKGIAAELMKSLERHATEVLASYVSNNNNNKAEPGCTVLLMHVEPSNEGALKFYERMSYKIVSRPDAVDCDSAGYLTGLDLDLLADNAGVSGQILLGKQL